METSLRASDRNVTPREFGEELSARLGAPVSVSPRGEVVLSIGAKPVCVTLVNRGGAVGACIPVYDGYGELVSLFATRFRTDLAALVEDVVAHVCASDPIDMPRYGATDRLGRAVAAMIDDEVGMEPGVLVVRELFGHAGFEVDVVSFSGDVASGMTVVVAEHGAWVCSDGTDGAARDLDAVGQVVEDFRAEWYARRSPCRSA
jgi:hypothetical protein